VSNRDNAILAALARLEAWLSQLEVGKDQIIARLHRVEAGQATLHNDLMARMDRLEGKVDRLAAYASAASTTGSASGA